MSVYTTELIRSILELFNHFVLLFANKLKTKDFETHKRFLLFFPPLLFVGLGLKNLEDLIKIVASEGIPPIAESEVDLTPFLASL